MPFYSKITKSCVVFCVLNALLVIILCCALIQFSLLISNCYRDLRPSSMSNGPMEQVGLTLFEFCICVMGFLGLWCKKLRGPNYLVAVGCLLTTSCVLQLLDLMMVSIFTKTKRHKRDELYNYMKILYNNYGSLVYRYKVNRIQSCLKCCGHTGPTDLEVFLKEDQLIPSCCPRSVQVCRKELAYAQGCVDILMNKEDFPFVFATISAVNGVLQFVASRVFMHFYV